MHTAKVHAGPPGWWRVLTTIASWLMTLVVVAAIDAEVAPDGPGRMHGWVPEDVPVLRGIVLEDGISHHEEWAEILRVMGWGYLRSARNVYNGDHGALLRSTVSHLAARTGHPELVHVPICTYGYSRFSGINLIVTKGLPGQLLSFANGFDQGTRDGDGPHTPNLKIATDVEDVFSADRSRRTESLGPPWLRSTSGTQRAFFIQWQKVHTVAEVIPFAMAYWDQVHRLRVPAGWDPREGRAELRTIPETDGWLADTSGFWTPVERPAPDDLLIAPFNDFPAERRDRASWLPDRETAFLYRAATSRFPWGQIIAPCKPYNAAGDLGDGSHAAYHNGLNLRVGIPVTIAVQVTIPDAAKAEAFVWSEPVGAATFVGGDIGTTRNATASFTWTPSSSRIWPIIVRVTRTDGTVGWLHPAVVPVHPAREP